MAAEQSDPSGREERLGEVVFAYLQAAEGGHPPDRREVLARHPEFAAELAAFFADRDGVRRLAPSVREVAGADRTGEAVGRGPPQRMGEYRILREVARGGMGVVYEAVQESL